MSTIRLFRHVAALALFLACTPAADEQDTARAGASGDTTAPAVACTLIGCEDQLVLRLPGAPAGPFRVVLETPGTGDSARRTFDCPAGQRCTDIPFPGFVPASVTARIIAGGDTTVQTLRPVYRTEYPNGPQCPPGCRIARESVTVRSGS
jgi:hypothetical protein